jgi:competence protein ComEA
MYRFYRFMYGLVGFSRAQSNGFLLFLPLLLTLLLSEPLYRRWNSGPSMVSQQELDMLDSLTAVLLDTVRHTTDNSSQNIPILVKFDPNEAGEETLLNAGIPRSLARRIIKYRQSGGRFFQKADLRKIYGFDQRLFDRIEPMLLVSGPPSTANVELKKAKGVAGVFEPIVSLDINTADSAQLKSIYGVGNTLCGRILKFRNSLGGFVSLAQLKEVYRLDTSIVKALQERFHVAPHFRPIQIRINEADRDQLATHPYISARVAAAIVAYRFQHGHFTSFDDLRRIPALDTATLRKLRPYVSTESP